MKKFTLLILLLVVAVGYGQSTVKTNGINNPVHYNKKTKKVVDVKYFAPSNIVNVKGDKQGQNNPVVYQKQQTLIKGASNNRISATDIGSGNNLPKNQNVRNHSLKSNTLNQGAFFPYSNEAQEEILADRVYRANLPSNLISPVVISNKNPLADIIPTAGATETFNPSVGDHFFDPGGPGGSSTGGTAGNYPNCGCDTQTTLAGVSEIDFQFFSVFATFDYLRIYDGTDATGTILYDNSTGGANSGDITLADMIASHGSSTFTSTSGNFFFFFHSSTVVDYGGWDVEIISAGGGGGGNEWTVNVQGTGFGDEVSWELRDNLGAVLLSGGGYGLGYNDTQIVTTANEPLEFYIESFGTFNDNTPAYSVSCSGDVVVQGVLVGGTEATESGLVCPGGGGDEWTVNVQGTGFGDEVSWELRDNLGAVLLSGGGYGLGYNDTQMVTTANEPLEFYIESFGTFGDNTPAYTVSCSGDIVVQGVLAGGTELTESGLVCAGGGGGGGVCSEENPNDFTFENGFNCSSAAAFMTANDVTVAADEDFTLSNITASIFANGGIANVDVNYYSDSAGLPGAIIGSEASVTIDAQTVIGANFGFNVNEVEMTVTPFVFSGQAGVSTKYWIELSVTDGGATGSVFWLITSSSAIGSPSAQFDGVAWGIPDPAVDGVYIWDGNCDPIGGGGGNCTSTAYNSTAVPFDIDGTGNVTTDCTNAPNLIPITVADLGTLGSGADFENITIDIVHTFTADLDLYLVSPSGTELLLANDLGGGTDNGYNGTMFEDGGADITLATAPFGVGPYAPMGGTFAAAFAGEDITGVWNLKLCDDAGGDTGQVVQFSMSICVPPVFTNDDCANAIALACGDNVTGETFTATNSGGNPAPDVFYKFTGTGTPQSVTISLCGGGTDYDSYLRVYDDCDLLNELAGNDDACGLQSEVTFFSDGTSTYYIMVEGFGSNSGNFSLDVTCISPPANDLCSNAIAVTCGDSITGSTIGSTLDTNVAGDCGTTLTTAGVWYSLDDTSGLAGSITLSLCGGTDFDSKISVYTGDCSAPPLTCVAGNDDSCGLQSEVTFATNGNTTFLILVHGFGGATGNFTMDVSCTPTPPPNDRIVNSIDVDEVGVPYTDPSVAMPAATTENGNPQGCDLTGANGVWYNFVAAGDGTAIASIVTPGGASSITFYTAPDENSTETDLVLVPQNSNQCAPGTSTSIFTIGGQTYYVFVLNSGAITDIVIDGTNLGVSDNTIAGFSYYPNPTTGVLNLSSIDNIEQVSIYSLLGQRVLESRVNATTSQMDISGLSTGTYLMKVTVDGQIGTYKVLKN